MSTAVASTTGFGLRLLAQLGPGPVAMSPLSVHAALATVRAGASGRSRAALDDVLGDDPPPLGVGDPAIVLALAQAVWVDRAYRLAPGFAEAAAERGVDCRELDFADPSAPGEVNRWAAEQTSGMIDRVVEELDPDEAFALADAAYFEGSWTLPFDRRATEERPFTRADGSMVAVPTMSLRSEVAYAEGEDYEAVRLDYGNGLELAFVALLPREGLEAPAPTEEQWTALRFESRPGLVSLPRLSLASSLQLSEPLTAMGLGPAFELGGDFEGLFEGPGPQKALSRVLHRAKVDLDEEGTRAAAVTVVLARAVSMPATPPVPFELHLDRPFLWAIEHRPTGTLLFLGRVTDPSRDSEEST